MASMNDFLIKYEFNWTLIVLYCICNIFSSDHIKIKYSLNILIFYMILCKIMRQNYVYFIDGKLMYQLSISHWYNCITCIYHIEIMRWIKCTDFTQISWNGLKLKITKIPSSRFQSNTVWTNTKYNINW
jgi:hypothetical protein